VTRITLAGPEVRAHGSLAGRATENLSALGALHGDVDWTDDDLSFYGRLVLEYGNRFYAMNREWAAWAASQIPPTTVGDGSGPLAM
jgi:hypothetical protein